MKWIPSGAEIARETLIVLIGALAAAALVGAFPAVKAWMREQWK